MTFCQMTICLTAICQMLYTCLVLYLIAGKMIHVICLASYSLTQMPYDCTYIYCQVASKRAVIFGQLTLCQIATCQMSYDCSTAYSLKNGRLSSSFQTSRDIWSIVTLSNCFLPNFIWLFNSLQFLDRWHIIEMFPKEMQHFGRMTLCQMTICQSEKCQMPCVPAYS